jgi:hypothetical protein
MPGIHTIIGNDIGTIKESDLIFTQHENNFKIKFFEQDQNYCLAFSYYDGYPLMEWQVGGAHIVVEGLIYNHSREVIKDEISEIASLFEEERDYISNIQRFVESCDGDFVVQIFQPKTKRILIFNDFLGRLTLYYCVKNGLLLVSKEIKTILYFLPTIELDKNALVEFLAFEFPFGNKTIFKDIFRLQSAQIIDACESNNGMRMRVRDTAKLCFSIENPFTTREESIQCLVDAFLESMRNRVATSSSLNYRIIADLSGGYDTRCVLAGLKNYTINVDYYTFEYTRDESPWAKSIFNTLGSPGTYHKLKSTNLDKEENIEMLVFRTDGLVNYVTTSVCYNDLRILKHHATQTAVRFSGLGGEFIRHPYKNYFASLTETCYRGLYSKITIDSACKIIKYDPIKYKADLQEYFNTYPEKDPKDQLKRFYYEYYHNYVNSAAEDRERIQFWTVQPLWNSKSMRLIFSRIPLDWVGFDYFIEFMKRLDPNLLNSPIYGSRIKLNSRISVKWNEAISNSYLAIYTFIKMRAPSLFRLVYGAYKSILVRSRYNPSDEYLKFSELFDGVECAPVLFDRRFIEMCFFKEENDISRILTLLMYIKELERRFSTKLIQPN